jgi:amidase
MVGADPRQPEIPPVPLDAPEGKSLKKLRIAWSDNFRVTVAVDIQTAFRDAIGKLMDHVAVLENWSPSGFDWTAAQKLYYQIAAYNFHYAQPITLNAARKSLTFIWREATQGEPSLRQLGNPTQVLKEMFAPTLKGYFSALTERDRLTARIDQALEAWDVWLIPVAATPSFTHRPAWSAIDIDGVSYPHAVANGSYTMPFNLSGHPVVVMPIGQTRSGLPIGIQIVGKRWREMELLAIAQDLDKVIGGFRQPSGY